MAIPDGMVLDKMNVDLPFGSLGRWFTDICVDGSTLVVLILQKAG